MRDNIEIYKKWIEYQLIDHHLKAEKNDQGFRFKQQAMIGRIIFYPHDFIEEIITENQKVVFYLYYVFESYGSAKKMFAAMMEACQSHQSPRVLMCCSGGLTSAFFVTKMRKYLAINHIEMDLQAAATSEIKELASRFDVILIAPQMRFALDKISKSAENCIVAAIPPAVFASYDCHGLYVYIEELFKNHQAENQK